MAEWRFFNKYFLITNKFCLAATTIRKWKDDEEDRLRAPQRVLELRAHNFHLSI